MIDLFDDILGILSIILFAAFLFALLFALFHTVIFLIDNVDEDKHSSGSVVLKFKTFKKYYRINPDRYNLRENFVIVNSEDGVICYIRFGYFDRIKYRLFANRIANSARDRQTRAYTIDLLEAVQSDIDRKRKESKECIEKANKILKTLENEGAPDIKLEL